MDDAAVVAAWAAAIAAVVGPIVSVKAAHWMAQQDNKRQEAARLFRGIIENAYQFRFSFLNHLSFVKKEQDAKSKALSMWRRPSERLSEGYQHAVEDSQSATLRRIDSESEMRVFQAGLQADILALQLLFDRQACEAVDSVSKLVDCVESMLNASEKVKPETATEAINLAISKITAAIKPLHDSLRSSDSFAAN